MTGNREYFIVDLNPFDPNPPLTKIFFRFFSPPHWNFFLKSFPLNPDNFRHSLFWKKIFDFPTLCMCRANRMCRIFPPIFMTKYVIPKIRHIALTFLRSFAFQNKLFFRTNSKTLDNFWSNGGCSAFFLHSGAHVARFEHLMVRAKSNETQNPTQT